MVDPQIADFKRWLAQPLEVLKELPDGDGGFIALATSCFLYERYATATIKAAGGKADISIVRYIQLATDYQKDRKSLPPLHSEK